MLSRLSKWKCSAAIVIIAAACPPAFGQTVEETTGTLQDNTLNATSQLDGDLTATLDAETGEFDQALPETGDLQLWAMIADLLAHSDSDGPAPVIAAASSVWTSNDPADDGNTSMTVRFLGFTDQYGVAWTRNDLIQAIADDAAFGGSTELAGRTFRATFEDPTIVVSEEVKDQLCEIMDSLGTPPVGLDFLSPSSPATQPAQVTVEVHINTHFGNSYLGGSVDIKITYKGTPEQVNQDLEKLVSRIQSWAQRLLDWLKSKWS